MKTDGVFSWITSRIPASYNKPINLIFQGDDHYNSPNFARTRWQRDMADLKELCSKEQTYFIKTGDTFEHMSTSEREYFDVGKFHESTKLKLTSSCVNDIVQYVREAEFMKERCLGIFGGNHFFRFRDGITSEQALASMLKAPYIGCSGVIFLTLDIDKHHGHTVKILVHHGKGSGRRSGSGMNAPEDMAMDFPDADIIVMGHDHKAGAMQLPPIRFQRGKGNCWNIVDSCRVIGRTGSYLLAYEKNVPSYAVDMALRPSTLGYLQIQITPRRFSYSEKGIDNRWIQIKAIV